MRISHANVSASHPALFALSLTSSGVLTGCDGSTQNIKLLVTGSGFSSAGQRENWSCPRARIDAEGLQPSGRNWRQRATFGQLCDITTRRVGGRPRAAQMLDTSWTQSMGNHSPMAWNGPVIHPPRAALNASHHPRRANAPGKNACLGQQSPDNCDNSSEAPRPSACAPRAPRSDPVR